jgi:hypothetical protein
MPRVQRITMIKSNSGKLLPEAAPKVNRIAIPAKNNANAKPLLGGEAALDSMDC